MNTAIIWKALFGFAGGGFLCFGLSAIFLNIAESSLSARAFVGMLQFSTYSFFVSIFFVQMIALFFFVTLVLWLVGRLFSYFLVDRNEDESIRSPSLTSIVAATAVVALFFNDTVRSVFGVLTQTLLFAFGTLPRQVLSETNRIIMCVSNEADKTRFVDGVIEFVGSPVRSCIGELMRDDRTLINDAVYALTDSSGLATLDFPLVLLAVVVFAGTIRIVDRAGRNATRAQKFWTAYSIVAGVAIYLALSATLSVSLLLERSDTVQRQTSETLTSRIKLLQPVQPNFEAALSLVDGIEAIEPIGQPSDTIQFAGVVNSQRDDAIRAKNSIDKMLAELPSAFDSIANNAAIRFTLVERESFSSREQALYFLDLLVWSQSSMSAYLRKINLCGTALRSKASSFHIGSATFDSIVVALPGDQSSFLADRRANFERSIREGDRLMEACLSATITAEAPGQRQLGSSLGPVGRATGWLLQTQSLPLTLVVGLVGYGLLGALISRFVVASDRNFRIDDGIEFAVVTLAGFVAALVVFVSSFGGMYILAREATDPNPYAVFALCLGGAIFSSSVWQNLRDRLGEAAKHSEEDGPDDPTAPKAGKTGGDRSGRGQVPKPG